MTPDQGPAERPIVDDAIDLVGSYLDELRDLRPAEIIPVMLRTSALLSVAAALLGRVLDRNPELAGPERLPQPAPAVQDTTGPKTGPGAAHPGSPAGPRPNVGQNRPAPARPPGPGQGGERIPASPNHAAQPPQNRPFLPATPPQIAALYSMGRGKFRWSEHETRVRVFLRYRTLPEGLSRRQASDMIDALKADALGDPTAEEATEADAWLDQADETAIRAAALAQLNAGKGADRG